MSLLDAPDAFARLEHVGSRLLFEGERASETPLLTIAIPTYRRFDLLCEAVRSAIEQDGPFPTEVIVVDNDPESSGASRLVAALPRLREENFRYFVNADNLGMFGNWNRCIELGRAEWHSLLNDDDLLEPGFVARMLPILTSRRDVEALMCRRRFFGGIMPPSAHPLARTARRIWLEARFGGRDLRPYPASKFFWGSGNPVGLIARKRDLMGLGGYQADEYPSSDHIFQLRLAARHRLFESRDTLARIRFQENEAMRPEVVHGMLMGAYRLRRRMAGHIVPRWWAWIAPRILVRDMAKSKALNLDVDALRIEREAGTPLPKDRPLLLAAIRASLGGY